VFYWFLKWIAIGPLLRVVFRPQVEGAENVPEEGPAILASNHLSYADWLFMPLTLQRRVTFVAKAEYFDDPKTAWFFRAVGQIPIRRTGGSAAMAALDSAAEVLEGGHLFGIYPEGTRSPDGRLYKGKTGVARLALRCQAPVLACAMIGTREVQPIGQVKPNIFRPITIRIGAPMDFSRFYDKPTDPKILRQITDEIMYELRSLSGQEYVHEYAKRKATDEDALEPERTPQLTGPPLDVAAAS
jgi:1-acyl-sn-glycerol-3-phosphate acyltransferase